jgi:hypothetical protein
MLIRDSWTVRTNCHKYYRFIEHIDCDGVAVERDGNELKSFRKGKNIYDIGGGAKFSDKMLEFDVSRDEITRKITYYNSKDLSKKQRRLL